MNDRPILSATSDSATFKQYYYLKSELTEFCRNCGLQTTGSKKDLTERIAKYLDTGKIMTTKYSRKAASMQIITLDTEIERDIVCSEKHRAFFKAQIGDKFSFIVPFQKWLKSNAGKTYRDAVAAYREISKNKKNETTVIDSQFEYNTYIRDFFNDNKEKNLKDAVECWNYKKGLPGRNRYEKSDLAALYKNK